MYKTALAFTLGALTAAAVLVYAGNSGPAAAFFGGFLVHLVAVAILLSSRPRIRAAADLLNRVAGGSNRAKATAAKASPLEADVVDALVQLGAKKATAAAAAAKAVAENPAGDFALVFRSALQISKA